MNKNQSSSKSRGRSPKVTDEEILNVIRRSSNTEVPTKDIYEDPSIAIGDEAVRNRLNQLEDENRVTSRSAGTMRMWKLGELESTEPVREPLMARAYRWENLSQGLGRTFGAFAFGLVFAAVLFFIMYLHTQTGNISPPLLTQRQVLVYGYVLAYTGAGVGFLAGILYGIGIAIPKLTAWRLARTDAEKQTNRE